MTPRVSAQAKQNSEGRIYYKDHLNNVETFIRPTTAATNSAAPPLLPTGYTVTHCFVFPPTGERPNPVTTGFNEAGEKAAIRAVNGGGGGTDAQQASYLASTPEHGGPRHCTVPSYSLYFRTDTCVASEDTRTCLESETIGQCDTSQFRSVYFESLHRVLRRYHGTANCDNSPVEEIPMANCTKVGPRRYTIHSVADSFVVPNYHPFKVKYASKTCGGNITELWSYDGCFERRRMECQGPTEFIDRLYLNDNCTHDRPACITNDDRVVHCGEQVVLEPSTLEHPIVMQTPPIRRMTPLRVPFGKVIMRRCVSVG